MRGKILIFILAILLLVISSTGCLGFGFDCGPEVNFIEVYVNADVCVSFTDGKTPPQSIMWSGAQIEIKIVKAGGERVQFEKITGSGGCTNTVSGNFRLYKEQPIEVIALPVNGVIPDFAGGGVWDWGLHYYSNNIATLLWSDVYPANDFGDTYYWNPTISMLVQPN